MIYVIFLMGCDSIGALPPRLAQHESSLDTHPLLFAKQKGEGGLVPHPFVPVHPHPDPLPSRERGKVSSPFPGIPPVLLRYAKEEIPRYARNDMRGAWNDMGRPLRVA